MGDYGFTREELRILKGLKTPRGIQRFLDEEVSYNVEKDGETCRSPRRVLRDRLAHCAEGALFAAAALRGNGHPPPLIDLSVLDRVQWMTTEKDLYIVSDCLTKLKHERLIPARMRLPDLRSREYA